MSRPRWLAHFGFDEPPFSKELADDKLWVPSSRQRVLDRLVEACTERTHVLLTGEPGVGKTCVLRALRQRLPKARYRLTYCHNATLGRRDFYRHICLALGLNPKATAAAVFMAITEHVQEQHTERVHPVFLLDEAHLLHQQVLAHLHILSNVCLEVTKRPGTARSPPGPNRVGSRRAQRTPPATGPSGCNSRAA